MRDKKWEDDEWRKINSKDDVERILVNINSNILYINKLFGKRRVSVEDTDWILDDFEKLDLGISKLESCKWATNQEINNFKNKRNELNEELKELNRRIYIQD
ncbi:hypothetical protein OD350_18260 [Clostridium beijerinckii]|uniref:Uncharacterized protein YdcH (DUF465 family) n=1 Tax=Clostridium beijerinckii TaxID=1520 RepID=A0AAX0BAH9_CLOBE|nr:hypothetical protein [Clostridium beijerinckii]NRT91478.1 uncharacterized protein YdcH (DUF465 family) [Clostridium beijerinckii]NYC71003.1 uncharacterized protein YdcH (DUF465 family) [Clostridium beijerinckii]UYZ34189.1 hypothetical protein OD350_18260 [Clostridium beijerinckii]